MYLRLGCPDEHFLEVCPEITAKVDERILTTAIEISVFNWTNSGWHF
jgi:hypothetical protein